MKLITFKHVRPRVVTDETHYFIEIDIRKNARDKEPSWSFYTYVEHEKFEGEKEEETNKDLKTWLFNALSIVDPKQMVRFNLHEDEKIVIINKIYDRISLYKAAREKQLSNVRKKYGEKHGN